jgi:NAD(P)-dependent dehydrogenase (short-subunit alcohol dehydrogenase family)
MSTGPDRRLEGQVALVTGAGRGIGRAIALELSGQGARVLITGRGERALGDMVGEIVHGGGQARHVAGDVRDLAHLQAAVARAIETWGRLDIAVANAGVTGTTRLGSGEEAVSRARDILDTNLFGAYVTFDAALAGMKGPGRLIAVSSVLGKWGVPGQAAYCASKAGLNGLVRAVAAEVGSRKITCNAVCPGWVDTEMARGRLEEITEEKRASTSWRPWRRPTYETTREEAEQALPIGRFVEPEEVAGFVAYLCSPAGAAITGQAISVCGGATLFAG